MTAALALAQAVESPRLPKMQADLERLRAELLA
jgi:hypothetical protein